jgi:hypothetical protein
MGGETRKGTARGERQGNIQLTEPYAVRQVELRRRRATEETTSEGEGQLYRREKQRVDANPV